MPRKNSGWWQGCIPNKTSTLLTLSKDIEGSLEVKLPTIWTDGKAEVGRVREEKSRREKRRSEKSKSEKKEEAAQVREKVGKSRNTVFFQWFVAPESRKVGSLKRRVRSHVVRWEMKSCRLLWREGHVQVKMYKTNQSRTTFGSWDVEKAHAVVQNTPFSDHFWTLSCRKSARRCGAKHMWKSKCSKHLSVGALLEVAQSKKCTPLWREAHFQVKMLKRPHARTTFEGSDVILRGRCTGFCTLPKVSKTWGFCSSSKNDGRRGTFAEDLQRCISPGRRSARDMFIRDVRRSGRWFPERGCILEHQICGSATGCITNLDNRDLWMDVSPILTIGICGFCWNLWPTSEASLSPCIK